MIMEEKKFDKQSIIGFLLIGAILLFMLWQNQPTEEELAAHEAMLEKVQKSSGGECVWLRES